MDTVWVDTMFPGIDPDEGWEKNLERVVNYDYLLKEYLDWQLKHLTVDNMDPVDWAKVEADIISMAAGSVDLTAYYDKDEVDAKAQLILDTADDHADAKLLSYYTKDEADAQAALTLETADSHTTAALAAYYTATEVDSAISTSEASMEAYADAAVAALNISAYYTAAQTDAAIQNTASQATLTAAANAASVAISAALGTLEDDQGNTLTVQQAISAASTLTLNTADSHTAASLQSYYTKSEIGDFTGYQTAVAALKAYADSAVANIDLSAYYTSSEVDSAISTSEAGLKLYTDNAVASIDLSAYATTSSMSSAISTSEASVKGYADGLISGLSLAATGSGSSAKLVLQSGGSTIANSGASMALSVTNNSNGYSTLALTAGGITLATSGQINLGGNVIFAGDNISYLTNNSGYQTRSGVVSIIDGTVDADYVNALGITAKAIRATGSAGAYVYGSTSGSSNYLLVHADGFDMVTGGYVRAKLYESNDDVTLRLGDSTYAYFQKYYSGGKHYIWVGGGTRGDNGVGLRINLSDKTYKLFGTAE